jgi:hypothetical protein
MSNPVRTFAAAARRAGLPRETHIRALWHTRCKSPWQRPPGKQQTRLDDPVGGNQEEDPAMIATATAETESFSFATNKPVEVSITWKYDPSDPDGAGAWTIAPDQVTINKKVAIILYRFDLDSTPGVRFALGEDANEPSPVLWIDPSNPDNFEVTTLNGGEKLVIADANSTPAGEETTFSFRLVAVYQDVTRISPDPTIINKQPS